MKLLIGPKIVLIAKIWFSFVVTRESRAITVDLSAFPEKRELMEFVLVMMSFSAVLKSVSTFVMVVSMLARYGQSTEPLRVLMARMEPSAELSLPSAAASLPSAAIMELPLAVMEPSAVVSLDSRPELSIAAIAFAFVVTLPSRLLTDDTSAFCEMRELAEPIAFVLVTISFLAIVRSVSMPDS